MVKKKSKKTSFWHDFSTFVITFFVLVLVGFFIFTNISIGKRRAEMMKNIEELKSEIKELEDKNLNLKAGISNSENLSYLEEEARNQGYKMTGETQVVVVPNENKDNNSGEVKAGFWQNLLSKIGIK